MCELDSYIYIYTCHIWTSHTYSRIVEYRTLAFEPYSVCCFCFLYWNTNYEYCSSLWSQTMGKSIRILRDMYIICRGTPGVLHRWLWWLWGWRCCWPDVVFVGTVMQFVVRIHKSKPFLIRPGPRIRTFTRFLCTNTGLSTSPSPKYTSFTDSFVLRSPTTIHGYHRQRNATTTTVNVYRCPSHSRDHEQLT